MLQKDCIFLGNMPHQNLNIAKSYEVKVFGVLLSTSGAGR